MGSQHNLLLENNEISNFLKINKWRAQIRKYFKGKAVVPVGCHEENVGE